VWRRAGLLLLVGCSFHTNAVLDDAPGRAIDARPDAPHDATVVAIDAPPPDACIDVDSDGICDDVDTWLCGVAPTAPATTVTMTGNSGQTNVQLTTIAVNGVQLVEAAPGASLAVSLHYAITDTACPQACIDQIEIGLVTGGRKGCLYDHAVSESTGAMGNAAKTLTAPTTPGTYDIRTNLGQNTSCGTTTSWWNAEPDDTRTIARLCVH